MLPPLHSPQLVDFCKPLTTTPEQNNKVLHGETSKRLAPPRNTKDRKHLQQSATRSQSPRRSSATREACHMRRTWVWRPFCCQHRILAARSWVLDFHLVSYTLEVDRPCAMPGSEITRQACSCATRLSHDTCATPLHSLPLVSSLSSLSGTASSTHAARVQPMVLSPTTNVGARHPLYLVNLLS